MTSGDPEKFKRVVKGLSEWVAKIVTGDYPTTSVIDGIEIKFVTISYKYLDKPYTLLIFESDQLLDLYSKSTRHGAFPYSITIQDVYPGSMFSGCGSDALVVINSTSNGANNTQNALVLGVMRRMADAVTAYEIIRGKICEARGALDTAQKADILACKYGYSEGLLMYLLGGLTDPLAERLHPYLRERVKNLLKYHYDAYLSDLGTQEEYVSWMLSRISPIGHDELDKFQYVEDSNLIARKVMTAWNRLLHRNRTDYQNHLEIEETHARR